MHCRKGEWNIINNIYISYLLLLYSTQVHPKRVARAEKAKAQGNDAYKAGRYMEAISAYSEAIKHNPANPVYISNRAMAYLKVFRCE